MLKIAKMHACGNDFIVLDGITTKYRIGNNELGGLAREMCDRRFGVGADGLLYLLPSNVADFKVRLFNADGSVGEVSGNGIRCAAKYFIDNIKACRPIKVETLAGILTIDWYVKDGSKYFTVDLGEPRLKAREIPVSWRDPESVILSTPINVPGVGEIEISAVNTGVPHVVIFVDNVDEVDVKGVGKAVRSHWLFPMGTNVDFAKIIGENQIKVRTYERGVEDETLCCGTGAAAVTAVSALLGKVDVSKPISVSFKGGLLEVNVFMADSVIKRVTITGTAHRILEGAYNPD